MALSVIANGTQTATVSTEHTLNTDTTGKTYILAVDTGNMVLGDELVLKIYTKVISSGTERLAYVGNFQHNQSEPNKYSVPVPANYSFKATLQQTAGTSRAFDWAVLAL